MKLKPGFGAFNAAWPGHGLGSFFSSQGLHRADGRRTSSNTRAHHGDEIPERDVTYHLTCLLIYHGTTTHL